MSEDEIKVSLKIKELRRDLNMTQVEFSELIGCTQAALSTYENGNVSPSLDTLISISKECKISLDWLCGLSSKKSNESIPKTMSDVFKALFIVLDEELETSIEFGYTDCINDLSEPDYISVNFTSKAFIDVLSGYKKMKETLDAGYIDDEIFALWKEKTYNKYKNLLTTYGAVSMHTEKDPNE